MDSNTIVETVDTDGGKLKLSILPLGHKLLQEAQMMYNIKLTSLIRRSVNGDAQLFSRQQLEQHLSELGIWTESDARQFLELQLELRASELELAKGGIKVSDAKKLALKMKTKRAILMLLYNRRSQFDAITMEAIADGHKFKFLLTKCVTVAEDGTPFFVNIDDYDVRQNEQAAIDAATVLAGRLYGYDQNTEANLIENKWLKQFKFADDKGRLIDKQSRLVDLDGRLIDDTGRFINEHGDLVDDQGRPVDEEGNFVVSTSPFLDDETGKPLEAQKTKCKKRRKSKVS